MGRQRKHADGKYDRGKPPLGEVIPGVGGVHGVVVGKYYRKTGKRRRLFVKVQWFCNPHNTDRVDRQCKVCHGKPVTHRYDRIVDGAVKSCGRRKATLRSDYMKTKAARIEAERIPPDFLGTGWKYRRKIG